jgi:hypothetical protein
MKSIVFDTGPVISLAMNNLLWILKPLKEKFNGEFYLPEAVKKECVDKPLTSKKFKFEAIQVMKLIEEGTIKVYDNEKLRVDTLHLLELANSLFKAQGNFVRIVQFAEIESIVAAKVLGSECIVVDEFITRTLIENPPSAQQRLENKLHMKVDSDKSNLARFKDAVGGIKVIRSVELVTIAYEIGMFKEYYLHLPNPKKTLLEGLLWGVKLNGCSVSEREIDEVIKIEKV